MLISTLINISLLSSQICRKKIFFLKMKWWSNNSNIPIITKTFKEFMTKAMEKSALFLAMTIY